MQSNIILIIHSHTGKHSVTGCVCYMYMCISAPLLFPLPPFLLLSDSMKWNVTKTWVEPENLPTWLTQMRDRATQPEEVASLSATETVLPFFLKPADTSCTKCLSVARLHLHFVRCCTVCRLCLLPSGTGYIQCIKPYLMKPPLDLILSMWITWVKGDHSECVKSVTSLARGVSNLHVLAIPVSHCNMFHVTHVNTLNKSVLCLVLHRQYDVLPWKPDAQKGVYFHTSFIPRFSPCHNRESSTVRARGKNWERG